MVFSRYIRPGLILLAVMTVLLGFVYPAVTAGIGMLAFPWQSSGSLIHSGARLIGSRLIGQSFTDPEYFWGRPSATSPQPYNGLASGGSNLGPSNMALVEKVAMNAKALREADPANLRPIPVDLVTASASGLDPDISPAAADYQAARVARARHMPVESIQALIAQHTGAPLMGILGESQVNVLELNLALDALR